MPNIAILQDGSQFIEQTSYNLKFIPIRPNEVFLTSCSIAKQASTTAGFSYVYSNTNGATISYRFRGRRIGITCNKLSGYGILSFDVDGVAYPALNCASDDSNTYNGYSHVIAIDLTDEEHVLTISKYDALPTAVTGFMVDDAATGLTFIRSMTDYHTSFDQYSGGVISVLTTLTAVATYDFWVAQASFTNTTAAPINVTLVSYYGGYNIIGPFPVPANDVRQITGPIYCSSGLGLTASAVGIKAVVGGQ